MGVSGISMGARALMLLVAVAITAVASPAQLPPFNIAAGLSIPAVNCGHPDANCSHGVGPGCAAAALNLTRLWLSIGGRGIDTVT